MPFDADVLISKLRARVFAIGPGEARFDRRGFPAAGSFARERLEGAGRSFISGYTLAITDPPLSKLTAALDDLEPLWRGFAYEGAAMALELLDRTSRGRDRFRQFVYGPAAHHIYLTYVGAGWAFAVLPWRRYYIQSAIEAMQRPLKWLVLDGYGFHEGYFRPNRSIRKQRRPRHLSGYALHAFDQGLGRCLWFFSGADPARAAQNIASFAAERRADLWSGVGLACCYAGGCPVEDIHHLRDLSGEWGAHLAQGAVFAAKARALSSTVISETEESCSILAGRGCGTPRG